ncbi:MAG: hypothetical protein ACHQIH_03900 [Ignavibacteria bacterium]
MNKGIFLFTLLLLFSVNSFSQLSLPESPLLNRNYSSSNTGNTIILSAILLITPTLVLEDGKPYFGLSKELSIGRFPFGRAEFDYSYIFRSERTNAIHLSYNLDIPVFGGSGSSFMISPGAGYYTDFTRTGFFGQLAIGLFATTGFSDAIAIHPCLKFRAAFIKDGLPEIYEISLGVGFGIYSR